MQQLNGVTPQRPLAPVYNPVPATPWQTSFLEWLLPWCVNESVLTNPCYCRALLTLWRRKGLNSCMSGLYVSLITGKQALAWGLKESSESVVDCLLLGLCAVNWRWTRYSHSLRHSMARGRGQGPYRVGCDMTEGRKPTVGVQKTANSAWGITGF
jgi:hypothetical protein